MSLFCKHEWEKVSETMMPSAFDIATESKYTVKNAWPNHLRRKFILVLACKKCGALNKTVEENP